MDDRNQNKSTSRQSGPGSVPNAGGMGGQVMQIELLSGRGESAKRKLYKFHKNRIILGSAHSCDIRIQETAVSNVHAVIEIDEAGATSIFDMASDSGVFVNGKKVVTSALNPGDEIKIGFSTLRFSVEEVEEAAKSTSLPQAMRRSGEQRLYFNEEEDFAPLMLENELEIIEIFDYSHTSEPALQVAIYWGETILDIQHFVDREAIWIGQDRGVDLVVPQVASAFPFITVEGGDAVLHFTENMTGVIRSGQQMQPIEDLIDSLRASPSGLHRSIKRTDLIKIQLGEITLFVSFTPSPPQIRSHRSYERDPLFFRIWASSLVATVALVLLMMAMDPPKPLEVDELPPQVTTIIFTPPKPVPLPKVVQPKVEPPKEVPPPMPMPEPMPVPMPQPMPQPMPEPMPVPPPMPEPMPEPMPIPPQKTVPVEHAMANPTPPMPMATPMTAGNPAPKPLPPSPMVGTGAPGHSGEGARFKGAEGERGRPDAPKADVKASKGTLNPSNNANSGAIAKGAQGKGAVETLAADLTGSISQALSGGSKGIREASGKMRGYGGFESQGAGVGMGEVGTGSGGGGNSLDVAGLGTKGLGAGKVGTGRGAIGEGGTLAGGRSRPSIEIGDGAETVILGGLDKDVIDKIIRQYFNQIRYCYEKEATSSPNLRGRVMTRFVIAASGRVSSAAVASSSLGNDSVHSCLTGVLKRITFPEPLGGGIVEVSYPFVFSPAVGN